MAGTTMTLPSMTTEHRKNGTCRFGNKCTRTNCRYKHPNQIQVNAVTSSGTLDVSRDIAYTQINGTSEENQDIMYTLYEVTHDEDYNMFNLFNDDNQSIDNNPETAQVDGIFNPLSTSQPQINQISKEIDGKTQLTQESRNKVDIIENILTPELNNKITVKYQVWNSDYIITLFIASGADVDLLSTDIYNQLKSKYDQPTRKTINAFAADQKVLSKLTQRLMLLVKYNDFEIKSGKSKYVKKPLQIWHMPCLPPNTVIISRDGMRTLGVGIYNKADVKRILYYHTKSLKHDIMPEDENINDLFNQIKCRHQGNAGIYRINPKSHQVQELSFEESTNNSKTTINAMHAQSTYRTTEQ